MDTDNGYKLWFGKGSFDDWKVYCRRPNGTIWFALDMEYLHWIRTLPSYRGVTKESVYDDFVRLYDIVREDYDENEAIELIRELDKHYPMQTQHWWAIFYMTMVAEMMKENAILKKRIKRLGVYNVLFDGKKYSPKYTANYMKGMDFNVLDELMIERGI